MQAKYNNTNKKLLINVLIDENNDYQLRSTLYHLGKQMYIIVILSVLVLFMTIK